MSTYLAKRSKVIDPRVVAKTLPNGLEVVTVALPHLHTTTVSLFIKVGSRFESREDNGLAHFVEHMLYRGTQKYPSSLHLSRAVERLGSSLHAETGRDYTLLQMGIEPGRLRDALEIFAELVDRPRFDDIDRERELVIEELKEDYGERGQEINGDDIARGMLFGEHPLGQRIVGPLKNVKGFKQHDVQRFFEKHYCASNAVLCVTGPIAASEVAAAASTLKGWRSGARSKPKKFVPKAQPPQIKFIEDSGNQTAMSVLFAGVPETTAKYIPFVGLLRGLDDGMSTRLHYQLCDQEGLAYWLNAAIDPLSDTSIMEVVGATSHEKVPALVVSLCRILKEMRDVPISEDEVSRIKTRYRYETLAAIDDGSIMAAWFGGTRLYYPPQSLSTRLALIEKLTAKDIQRAARETFTSKRVAAAFVGRVTPKGRKAISDALASL